MKGIWRGCGENSCNFKQAGKDKPQKRWHLSKDLEEKRELARRISRANASQAEEAVSAEAQRQSVPDIFKEQ